MSIDKITAQLGQFSHDKERKMPPVELILRIVGR